MTMKHPAVALALAVLPLAAPAQGPADTARALILPMLQEIQPGRPGEILTDCVIGAATEAEIATFAAAPGPSLEIGAIINAILQRPATLQCLQAAVAG
jgi:hypothetical protein